MSSKRWFDERQIGVALYHAAKNQGVNVSVPRRPRGLSVEGLLALGEELGIDRDQVSNAIRQLDEAERSMEPFAWFGTTPTFKFERIVEGSVPDETWRDIVLECRRSFGPTGFDGQLGDVREWSIKEGLLSAQLSLVTEENHTRMRLLTDRTGQLVLIWACSVVASLLGAALFGEGLRRLGLSMFPMIGFSLGLLALLVVFVRAGVSAWARKDRRKLADLMTRLEDMATKPVEEKSGAPVTAVVGDGPKMI